MEAAGVQEDNVEIGLRDAHLEVLLKEVENGAAIHDEGIDLQGGVPEIAEVANHCHKVFVDWVRIPPEVADERLGTLEDNHRCYLRIVATFLDPCPALKA
eukprot:1199221-Pyramimonas_sp.AAC.1